MTPPDSREGEDPRARLLAAVIAYGESHGLSNVSLRELARAIGTSHRMLLYHFGSRQGLLVAVVQAVEGAQRDYLSDLATSDVEPLEALRDMWDRVADPALWPQERLFFELYGQALQGRPGAAAMLPGVIDDWLVPGAEHWAGHGSEPSAARAAARLGLAVIRGLLLDLVATEDRSGVDEAMARYLQLLARERPPSHRSPVT